MTIERVQSFVFGEWRDGSSEGAMLVNPATEEALATADSTGIDLAGALDFARTVGGPALRALTFVERAELLQKMSTAIHAERDDAARPPRCANGGCTRSDAKFDVDGAIGTLAVHYAELGAHARRRRASSLDGDADPARPQRSRFWGQHVFVPRTGVAVLHQRVQLPRVGPRREGRVSRCSRASPSFTKAATPSRPSSPGS
jgi:3,4-dehydroadipyl-CoA semialdehyde dehydrogenase